jgi:hypothetical protein
MEDFQIELLQKKSFDSLSSSEKNNLREWCVNEEEFQALKSLFIGVNASRNAIHEDVNAKNKLDVLFDQQFKKNKPFVLKDFLFPTGVNFIKQPVFQFAFLAILFVGITILFLPKEPVVLAKHESQIIRKRDKKIESVNEENEVKKLNSEELSENKKQVELADENFIFPNDAGQNTALNESLTDETIMNDSFTADGKPESTSFSKAIAMQAITSESEFSDDGFASKDDQIIEEIGRRIEPVSEKPTVLDYLFTTY